ncbi:DUF262 domain-containing protein [Erwinia sp.]|uniref:DUF262 domain-containing protein n=1 Tax=Erwinia citreus TaxID=558 RepID=UPI0028A2D393|nr:DUF262 domain-containing protein [Erwinia sp.]
MSDLDHEDVKTEQDNVWFEDYADNSDPFQISEYDITSTPNDFNVMTLFSFVESGAVKIPGFQRNFVWDIARSSKLIESLILGLPVPQIFLYEQARNSFLVIDGQQRLMSIYYFVKKRFPRKEMRVELREIFDQEGKIPDDVLHDDRFFQTFNLKLPEKIPGVKSIFKGLNYSTLGDYKTQFDLRPLRNIIVKQNTPDGDDSSMYEIFNRLNTGGINLRPQEIRTSMYHSSFYEMLYRINSDARTRNVLGSTQPDLHVKDIEIILRGFAMLMDKENYVPSMVKFLNQFSKKCKNNSTEQNEYLHDLYKSFLDSCSDLADDAFINRSNNRFNIALYEAVFRAACLDAFNERRLINGKITNESINSIKTNSNFTDAASEGTTKVANVEVRLNLAQKDLVLA